MKDAEIYETVMTQAIADAYDRGRAVGRAEGYDAGFLAAARAEEAQDGGLS